MIRFRVGFVPIAWVSALVALTFMVSCNEPTEVTVIAPTDSVPVFHVDTVLVFHVDTVLVFHVDSIYIWCWETDHNRDGHSAAYICTNGYQGPLK